MMIRYEYTEGRSDVPVRVSLDGRIVGEIRPVMVTDDERGWQYFPKGQTKGGEIYPSLSECQRSLQS